MGDNFKTRNISSHQFNNHLDLEQFLDEIGRIKQLQPTLQTCSMLSLLHEQCLQPVQPMNQELKRNYTKTVIRTHIYTPRIIKILHNVKQGTVCTSVPISYRSSIQQRCKPINLPTDCGNNSNNWPVVQPSSQDWLHKALEHQPH